MQDWNISCS